MKKNCERCDAEIFADESGIFVHICRSFPPAEIRVVPTPTMQPFRAWVAWHPTQCDKAPRIFDATKSGAWFTLLAIQGYLKGFDTDEEKEHAMRTAIEDGWRIVEVEVREVGE